MKRSNAGFTLIELMIVIAIIAIIAAIAIPGLLQSQRASNERNASASLKTLATAEADFRSNDRDGNHIQDFWTGDVSQLYCLCPIGDATPIKLIEISVAGADATSLAGAAGAVAVGTTVKIGVFINNQPKAGYWYHALINDQTPVPVAYGQASLSSTPVAATGNSYNLSEFGFMAFPDTRNSGRNVFIINEGNTIFKRSVTATYNPAKTAGVPNAGEPLAAEIVGATPPNTFPDDTSLKADFSKMD